MGASIVNACYSVESNRPSWPLAAVTASRKIKPVTCIFIVGYRLPFEQA
jgi:hypothetical protein